jgi:hypothetical protein
LRIEDEKKKKRGRAFCLEPLKASSKGEFSIISNIFAISSGRGCPVQA